MVYLFALPPKVEVVEDPSTGSATITWYESSLQWRTSNRTILALNSPPWHQIGVRPFAWDYFELEWAHLRLAVARGVTVTQRTGPPGREQNVPIGWNALDPKRYPQVHLHRCQDEGLLTYHFDHGLSLFPALTMSDADAEAMIEILHDVLDAIS